MEPLLIIIVLVFGLVFAFLAGVGLPNSPPEHWASRINLYSLALFCLILAALLKATGYH